MDELDRGFGRQKRSQRALLFMALLDLPDLTFLKTCYGALPHFSSLISSQTRSNWIEKNPKILPHSISCVEQPGKFFRLLSYFIWILICIALRWIKGVVDFCSDFQNVNGSALEQSD